MTRFFVLSLLSTGLAACQSEPSAGNGDATFCDAVMPSLTPWDGTPLPPPKTDIAAVYLSESPNDPNHIWAISTDGDQVTKWIDLERGKLGLLVTSIVEPNGNVPGPVKVPPIKWPPPPPPMFLTDLLDSGKAAAFFLSQTRSDYEAAKQVVDQFKSGQSCR